MVRRNHVLCLVLNINLFLEPVSLIRLEDIFLLSLWFKLAKNHLAKVQGLLMASKLHTNLWVVSKKYAGNMPTVGIVQHASGFPKLYKAVYLLVVHIMLL